MLFKKTQKLLDRFLFIFFAEDSGLLPPNSIKTIIDQWTNSRDNSFVGHQPLYDFFKYFFKFLNEGNKKHDIFAYNGGLFEPDDILDNIKIDDTLLYTHTQKLSAYDFESEVDVNILGHIFEHSLNEIEEMTAEIEGTTVEKSKTKRKKDGVFYTPKYITKYIVENTVGQLCENKKAELAIDEAEYNKSRRGRKKATLIKLKDQLEAYRTWLLGLTICDPACGSGAFLNQALSFLIEEHHYIDELQTKLLGGDLVFPNVENAILENNLYGVDINEESVEIAKLSLWLRSAKPKRKLTSLNSNIKCGNSLIDDPTVAGEKAFNWEKEFPKVFENGGFDVVIGNPPYGAFISIIEREYYRLNYGSFQGNYEIYFFFIELSNTISKAYSNIGYITPDTWINIPQAKKLRELVLNRFHVSEILSFYYNVFEDASLNPIVFILSKPINNELCKITMVDTKNYVLDIKETTRLIDISIWKSSLDKQFQIRQSDDDTKLIEKIKTKSKPAIEYLDVSQGIVPYSKEHLTVEEIKNKIFHSTEKLSEDYGLWVQGRAIKRYRIDLSNEAYLRYGEWLHRPRKPKYFKGERILIQEITGGNPPRISSTIFTDTLYHDPGIISCLNISKYLQTRYLLALINSKLISWFNIKTSPKGNRRTFPKVLIGDIRKFPIIETNLEQQKYIINKVDDTVEKGKNLSKKINRFQKRLTQNLSIIKPSKKLQTFYEYDFKTFLQELKKKKVKLKLSEQDEWEDYFNDYKTAINQLQAEIAKTDKEIDAMVYELYGLTEDEIKIVENS